MAPGPRAAVICALLALAGGSALAEKHALLIGVGNYPKPLVRLDGPPHDVDALRRRLIDDWGFEAANVATLIDAEASKAAVLGGLDRLAAVTRPGDYVFVYYSGHGTSAFDEDLVGLPSSGARVEAPRLGKWTGALIPHDYAAPEGRRPAAASWTDRLIVGRRDLRPRLAELDHDRNLFVVFDTCFSGNSVRSISKRRVRWVPPASNARGISHLEDPFDDDAIFGAATAREEDYPYRRLIYLSAARKYERAEEIPSWETVDARPHGALTHALLRGLDGAADADADDRLTYGELYRFVQDEVSEKHQHMPQLLYPKSRPGLVRQPVFEGGRRSFTAAPPVSYDSFRVRIGLDLDHLRLPVERLAGVDAVERGPHHLSIERQADGRLALYHSSGDHIAGDFDDRSPGRLLERIARLAQVQALIDLSYPRQHFHPSLELSDGGGFLYRDQRFDVTARTDPPAVLLLLNVDKTGTVSVLYPIHPRELRRSSGLRETFEVIPPYGTEYLKLFAFLQTPAGLGRWIHRKIDPMDPDLDRLLELLREPGVEAAQTRLKLVTVGELVSAAP